MAASVVSRTAEGEAVAARGAHFHIPSLDGLRALSFFIVFAAHAGIDAVPGGLGVTVFFFLSGYLITTLLRMEVAKTGRISLKHFYLRRVLRILPPFYIVLFATTALGLLGFPKGGPPLQLVPCLSQALHFSNYWIATHDWSGIPLGTGVYWSLAVEEHFYFVFPIAFLAMHSKALSARHQAFALWGVCALVLAWRCVLVLVLHSRSDRTYLCSDTRLDSIVFGCALAVWKNPLLDAPKNDEKGAPTGVSWLKFVWFPAGVALLLLTLVFRNPAFRETVRYTLQGIALTPIFVAAVRCPRWPIFRPLNWQPMRFIGNLSYVLYLVHQAAIYAISSNTSLRGVPAAMTALAIAIALAWIMHRFIEMPCAKLRKRISAVA